MKMSGKQRHCVLCKQFYKGKEVTLFRVPFSEQRRQRWSSLCGMPLTVNNFVCMYHFKLHDFIHQPDSVIGPMRLHQEAIPSRKADFSTPTFSLLLTKPPNTSTCEEQSPLEPLELIDEKIFDEQLETGDIELANQAIEASTIDPMPILRSSRKTNMSKETQTQSTDSSELMRTCGIVDVSMDNKKYTLHCYLCNEPFPLWDWGLFVRHVSVEHQDKTTSTLPSPAPFLLERPFKLTTIQSAPLSKEVPIPKLISTTNADPLHKTETAIEKILIEPHDLMEHEFDGSESSASATVPPQLDSENSETEANEESDYSSPNTMEEGMSSTKRASDWQLNFSDFEPPVVLSFLDLLQSKPILWKGEEVDSSDHKLALSQLATAFNAKWPLNLTQAGLKLTIISIKSWFLKQLRKSTYGDPPTGILNTYFQKCKEFLPSVPSVVDFICALCGELFVDEVQLQVHQVLEHPIRDFPFKCDSCEWRYVDASKLEMHERTHRAFYCDACRKNLETSEEFREHMAAHESYRKTTYCQICRKQFRCASRFRQHYQGVHGTPKHKCPICGKAYRKRPQLRYHIKAHNNQRDFVCDECGKSFVRPQGLKQHKEEAHTPAAAKSFPCRICNDDFKYRSELSTHQRKMHVAFEGSIEELELLQRRGDRRRKRRAERPTIDPVTMEERYHCQHCECKFRHLGGLQRHRKDKHGYLPVRRRSTKRKCGNSSKATQAARLMPNEVGDDELEDFKDSIRQDNIGGEMFKLSEPYTLENRFHCSQCDSRFKQVNELYCHRRIKHGNVPANQRGTIKKEVGHI